MQACPEAGLWEGSGREGDRVKRYLGGKVARFYDKLNEKNRLQKERRKGGLQGRLVPGSLFLDGQMDNGSLTDRGYRKKSKLQKQMDEVNSGCVETEVHGGHPWRQRFLVDFQRHSFLKHGNLCPQRVHEPVKKESLYIRANFQSEALSAALFFFELCSHGKIKSLPFTQVNHSLHSMVIHLNRWTRLASRKHQKVKIILDHEHLN